MDLDALSPWISTQQKRGAVSLRLKVGGPRSLQSRGTVDLEVNGEPCDVDAVVVEVREDLAGNGWPAVCETWGLDALDAEGRVLKSCQDTAKDGGSRGNTPQVTASRSDWEVTVAALVSLAGQSHELSKVAIAEAGKERAERRLAEAEAAAAREAHVEAEAAAMIDAALTAAETRGDGEDDSMKARGVEALEKMMDRLAGAGKKTTREDLINMMKDPKNRDLVKGLASDAEFLDELARAAGAGEDVPPVDPPTS